MAKKRKGGWIGLIILAFIMGAIAMKVVQVNSNGAASNGANAVKTDAQPATTATGTEVLIGVPHPSAASDTLYRFLFSSGELKAETPPVGWRVSSIEKVNDIHIQPPENPDGAFRLVGSGDWDVVLRAEDGRRYTELQFIGLLNGQTAAVAGRKDGIPKILIVHRNSFVKEAYDFPEFANIQGIHEGALWITTANPGPGLESPQQGPSSAVRIDANGDITVVKTDDDVILHVLPGPSQTLAYLFDGGAYQAESGSYHWEGTGHPLIWIDATHLLVTDGKVLKMVNLQESKQDIIGELDGVPEVASLSNVN